MFDSRSRRYAAALAALALACAASSVSAEGPKGLLSHESARRGPIAALGSPGDEIPDFSFAEPLDIEHAGHELGGYVPESSKSARALEAGRFAVLKLNCARLHAKPKCDPLTAATVTSAYVHVTETDFWFVNITLADERVLHATVAIDEVHLAPDMDCPELSEGPYAEFNLVRLEEWFDPRFAAMGPGPGPSPAPAPAPDTDADLGEDERSPSPSPGPAPGPEASYAKYDDPARKDVRDVCEFRDSPKSGFLGGFVRASDRASDPLALKRLRVEGEDDETHASALGRRQFAAAFDFFHEPGVSPIEQMSDAAGLGGRGNPECADEKTSLYAPDDFEPPEYYDLKDHYSYCEAAHAGNQGACGSCWAFAAAYMYSYRLCVQTKGLYKELMSPQQLVACQIGGRGCNGGSIGGAMMSMQINNWNTPTAIPADSEFPYLDGNSHTPEPTQQQCMWRDMNEIKAGVVRAYATDLSTYAESNQWIHNGQPVFVQRNCHRRPKDSDKLTQERWVMHQIMTKGAVGASMVAGQGIRGDSPTGIHTCGGCPGYSDHAVIIVGWGADKITGEKYWIMQNSWSHHWKDEGRVKIRRGVNDCCIESNFNKIDPKVDIMFDPSAPVAPSCSNGGHVDPHTRLCKCPPPWKGEGVGGEHKENGCETCGLTGCEHGGVFDEEACTCTCPHGFGGPECSTTMSSRMSDGLLIATLNVGHMAAGGINSDVAVAVRLKKAATLGIPETGEEFRAALLGMDGSSEWKVVTERGELCGHASTSPHHVSDCPEVARNGKLVAKIDLRYAGVHADPGDQIEVKFVQNLGLNEFGNPRGYDMDAFGEALESSFKPQKCKQQRLDCSVGANWFSR